MRSGKSGWILVLFGLGALACTSSDDGGNDAGAASGGTGGSSGSTSNGGTSGHASGGTAGTSAGAGGTSGNAGSNGASGSGGDSAGGSNDAGTDAATGDAGSDSNVSFFITSTGNTTGNLGGLAGADAKCTTLATAAGFGGKTWHAYLSAEGGPNGTPVNAKDRIGHGPWYNVNGVLIAQDLTALHALNGDYMLFLDENGVPVPGQWTGSPKPVVHDILTGSNRDGTVKVGYTCSDWTSESASEAAWVGHTDGLGPPGNDNPEMYLPWNSVHDNGGCNDTVPRGGGGRIACFAVSN